MKLDIDGSGTIEIDEFLMATANKDKLLCPNNLYKIFKYFDEDGSGSISL